LIAGRQLCEIKRDIITDLFKINIKVSSQKNYRHRLIN